MESFIQSRKYLFWYVKDLSGLSSNAVVEGILNLGDWQDFQDLIKILGLKKISQIFLEDIKKDRNNYRPEIKHYFELYFKKYVK